MQDLAARIRRLLGPNELFVRYGGDEFGILIPFKDAVQSGDLAEQVRQAPDGAADRGLSAAYTISIGILTVLPDRQTQLETLYTLCDKALYAAKHNGRNRIVRSSGAAHDHVFP